MGATLRQELQCKKRLIAADVLTILHSICAAIEAAHGRGLVHRDLKPENIFLVRSGSTEISKVLDFGLAKFVTATAGATQATTETIPGILLGTPDYMSPEQLRGEAVNKSWDIVTMTHFDGKGNLTWVEHEVVGGNPLNPGWLAANGTYSVNPDCTGLAVVITPNSPVPLNLYFVVVKHGQEIHAVLDSNAISTVFIRVE